MLRIARAASLPRLFFYMAEITSVLMKRLSNAVRQSNVSVEHCEFVSCRFYCAAEEMVDFLRLCRIQNVAFVGGLIPHKFAKHLVKDVSVMNINIIIPYIPSFSNVFPEDSFCHDSLQTLLKGANYL
ncbi:hypothetical protein ANCCAN_23310 [Ancylostoma caninum]|uniref:Receptor ligand binding region domain-containing protein n=1 Tax=Ancylostoma caninum TaxID=29170 RepID=A0A368FFK2_ANCCA|nr:hypothetical protein ANCCAN_23310 [Ancylostoma caninum]